MKRLVVLSILAIVSISMPLAEDQPEQEQVRSIRTMLQELQIEQARSNWQNRLTFRVNDKLTDQDEPVPANLPNALRVFKVEVVRVTAFAPPMVQSRAKRRFDTTLNAIGTVAGFYAFYRSATDPDFVDPVKVAPESCFGTGCPSPGQY